MRVGGLGHMAIQLLRVLAPVRLIATDVDEKKLDQAKALGADETVNNRNADEAAERIQKITGPRGAGLVLDCVGVHPTIDLGAKLLGRKLRLDHRWSRWRPPGLSSRQHALQLLGKYPVLGLACRTDGGDCDGA